MLQQPTQPPRDPRGHLLSTIRAIVDRAEEPQQRHRIIYRVSGGPPTRRLEYALEVQGSGSVTLHLVDELRGHRTRTVESKLSSAAVMDIFRALMDARLLENVDTGGGFLPDSLIGSITVEDGASRITFHFLADEQQRRNQGRELNPSLARMHTVLEQLTNQMMRKRGSKAGS
jgi:hypothetical protein